MLGADEPNKLMDSFKKNPPILYRSDYENRNRVFPPQLSYTRRIPGGDGPELLHRSPRLLMKFKTPIVYSLLFKKYNQSLSTKFNALMAAAAAYSSTTQALTISSEPLDDDNNLCSEATESSLSVDHDDDQQQQQQLQQESSFPLGSPGRYLSDGDSRIERAWAHWDKLRRPKLIVAPMVDNSELPFRLLCRKYGAQAAYTPMLHSCIFTESAKYRSEEFSTCKEDRPLFVQFCANDPDTLLEAAQKVEPYCDYVDINLGCPQRIARRGYYGAFLMDNLTLVKSLVEKLALNLNVPVSCKNRVFPDLEDTLNYAKMLEDAGCSLLAVHDRTRDEKDGRKIRANWDAIRAVKNAVRIPVLANGNIRHMDDVQSCLEQTGADGVLSADPLLENPALFAGCRTAEWIAGGEYSSRDGKVDQAILLVEYLKLCEKHPVPWRIIRSHVHKLLGEWFRIHPHVREDLNAESKLTFEFLYDIVTWLEDLGERVPLYVKDTHVETISANGVDALN